MSKKANTLKSVEHAIDGLKTAFKQEPNFKIHTIAAIIVLALAYFFRVERTEWILLLFTIFFVLIMELLNTVLEAIVDLVQPTYHKKAKVAKDVAAAGVLLSAIVSVIVGALIFIPKILQ